MKKPKAHPTKWTLVVQATMRLGKPFQLVYDYNTEAEAEAELVKAKERGQRAYVLPPVAACGPEKNEPRLAMDPKAHT
jgi:hypothetical protein